MPGNLVNVSSAPRCFNERCSWSAAWRTHTHTHFLSTINTIARLKHTQTHSGVKMSCFFLLRSLCLHLFFCIPPQDLSEFSRATNPLNRRSLDLPIASTAHRRVCAHPIGCSPYLPRYFSDGEKGLTPVSWPTAPLYFNWMKVLLDMFRRTQIEEQ